MTSHIAHIRDRIVQIFAEQLHVESVARDTDLIETGILDSFMLVELMLLLEQHFDIRITMESLEIEDFRSVEMIANLVAKATGSDAGENDRGILAVG
jgi:acyl carrier protein